jgi:hypothetical protein
MSFIVAQDIDARWMDCYNAIHCGNCFCFVIEKIHFYYLKGANKL